MENLSSTVQTREDMNNLMNSLADMHFDAVILFRRIILVIWVSFSVGGIFTNVINLHTFIRMGLDDSVTISFFALAVCDFFNCILMLLEIACCICEIFEDDFELWLRIRPAITIVYVDVFRKAWATVAILITTFLAVQRCLCVLIPFHVKGMFTRFKTHCFLVFAFIVCFVPLSLYCSRYRVGEVPPTIKKYNATQLGIHILPNSELHFFLVDVLLGFTTTLGGQFVVVICLIIIFVSLRKSMRFKQETQASGGLKKANADDKDNQSNTKEMQAMKQVGLISLIFVCTNSPYFALLLGRIFVPEFGLYKKYHIFFIFMYVPIFVTEMMGSAVNFFVYYKYNTKFRSVCILTKKKKETSKTVGSGP